MATTTRRYKGKVYHSYLLRRSFRVGSQVRHETLGNLSHLPAPIIDLIRRSLAGESFVPAADTIGIESSLPHGHVQAVCATLQRLELPTLLSSQPCRERDLCLAMIAERILHPCSKLATTRLWNTSTLAQEFHVSDADEDQLYDALDWLLQRQSRIEKRLAARHLTGAPIVLYDVSSSSYEGRHCPLARLGYNRDGKHGVASVVYGLLTDTEGRPVAIQVYPGNTGDPATVPDQVEKLRSRFSLARAVLVGDRGMLTEAKIQHVKNHPGLGWISALRAGAVRQLADEGSLQLSLFDEQNLAEIRSPEYPGERLVACFNPLLAEERGRKRQELLAATERDLTRIAAEVGRRRRTPLTEAEIGLKVGRVANRYKMAKHFRLSIGEGVFTWSRDEQSIQREADLDGIYVIRTSEARQQLPAAEVVRRYKSLAQVERAFRTLKGLDLRIRPIHHRTDAHVRGHIFLCMLAYYVEWHMRQALAPLLFDDEELAANRKRRDPVAPAAASDSALQKKSCRETADGLPLQSFPTLLTHLSTLCRNTCRIQSAPDQTFQQLTQATPLQAKALEFLAM